MGGLVTRDGDQLAGIVTDRDLVARCLADGAVALMRARSLRRVPVASDGRPVGISASASWRSSASRTRPSAAG